MLAILPVDATEILDRRLLIWNGLHHFIKAFEVFTHGYLPSLE
jgi:hypothetical protein